MKRPETVFVPENEKKKCFSFCRLHTYA